MRFVHTSGSPAPAGHYSQAVVHGGLVYVAGILPWDPDDPGAPLGDVEAQVRRVCASLEAVLTEAGSGLSSLLQLTVYVTEGEHWGTVNSVLAEVLGEHRPARAIIPAGELKRGAALELTATAAVVEG